MNVDAELGGREKNDSGEERNGLRDLEIRKRGEYARHHAYA